jgi:hypothetical protein
LVGCVVHDGETKVVKGWRVALGCDKERQQLQSSVQVRCLALVACLREA